MPSGAVSATDLSPTDLEECMLAVGQGLLFLRQPPLHLLRLLFPLLDGEAPCIPARTPALDPSRQERRKAASGEGQERF